MTFENAQDNLNKMLSLVMRRAEAARDNAVSPEEARRLFKERYELDIAFARGDITKEQLEEKLHECAPHEVEFDSLAEFAYCVRHIGLPPGRADEILAHENSHMNTAEMNDLKGRYKLAFVKYGDGYGIIPNVAVIQSDTMSDADFDAIDEKITSAPDNLSPGDLDDLKRLQEKKNNR